MTSSYPKREPYFALKFMRKLKDTGAAQSLGPGVCWLLGVIACEEDAKRYREPANFYYEQLMPLCGFRSKKQLRSSITKAVEQGWLEYSPGRKGVPCKFSVVIPKAVSETPLNLCEEKIFSSDSKPETEPQKHRKRNRNGNTPTPNTHNPNKSDSSSPSSLRAIEKPSDVSELVWADWLVLRLAKNAPVTATVILQMRSKAADVAMSLEQVLSICCERGWAGFDAKWLDGKSSYAKPSRNDRTEYQNYTGKGQRKP